MSDKKSVMQIRFPRITAGFGILLVFTILLGTCASGAVVSIQNGTIQTIGGETTCDIVLDSAPGGFLGYRMNLTLDPAGIAEFELIRFPEWAGFLNSSLIVSPTDLYVKAADLGQVNPGATNIFLGAVTVKGISNGVSIIALDNVDIQDENGNWIECTIRPGTITVGSGGVVPTTETTTPPTTVPTTTVTTTEVTTSPTTVVTTVPTTAPTTVPTTVPTTKSYLPDGNIYLTSSPTQASVSLDGQPKGETPVLLSASPGQHALTVTADGYYPYSGTVTFNSGAMGVRSVKLQSTSGGQPTTSETTATFTTGVTTSPTGQPTIVPTTTGGFSWPVFQWPKITLPDFRPPWPFNFI